MTIQHFQKEIGPDLSLALVAVAPVSLNCIQFEMKLLQKTLASAEKYIETLKCYALFFLNCNTLKSHSINSWTND